MLNTGIANPADSFGRGRRNDLFAPDGCGYQGSMTTYQIERLGMQGDGIASGPVYVPRALPGEVVTGTLSGQSLTDVRIETPSDDRVKPPCPHYKGCGGCQLQHASDAFVADWKQDAVRRALSAQGIDAVFRPIATSPSHSRRRATFAARRTKKGTTVGFHGRASDTIVPVPDCHLLDAGLKPGLDIAHALAATGASRKATLSVHCTLSSGGLDVMVSGGKPLDGPLRVILGGLAEDHRLTRLVWEDEPIAQRTPPRQDFDGIAVVPPPGAFLQATEHGETALRAGVHEVTQGAGRIIDLFAGCGTFALPLARDAQVHAVEGSAAMIEALDHGWRNAQGLKQVTTEVRDLFRNPLMAEDLTRYDAAVIDPPRAGAQAQVETLAKSGILAIAFVSCNPVTFAREARVLIDAGYHLHHVQVVDQFRWSPHIELVAAFGLDKKSET